MKKTIKLLKAWEHAGTKHAIGAVLEVDETTAAELIEAGAAELVTAKDGNPAPVQGLDEESVKSIVKSAIDEKLSVENIARKRIHIEVKDRSDDDPCFGYLGEHSKSADDLTDSEVFWAFGQFARDVGRAQQGREPDRLVKCRERTEKMITKAAGDGMVVGDDEFGGYLIFPAATALIQRRTVEAAVVRPRARTMTMGTQSLRIPLVRDENRTSGQIYQGIRVYWEDELDQATSSRPKLRRMELKLKKLMALGYVSGEFGKWSPVSLGSWLIPMFGEAIGYTEDIAFLNGKGGGQPLGMLNSGCKISVSAETNQDADTFVLENSTKMFARLLMIGSTSVVWFMNQTVFPQLPLLNVSVGTGGQPVFVNSIQGAPGQSLWGYPIQYTEKVPVLGDAGDVILANVADYVVADDQSGPQVAQSIHLKFDYDQEAFRIIKYVDGQNMSDTAFTPYTAGGTSPDTLSPVVTLAARA
jgi:HK97 family phage major capsid protein